jgi:hypothetical protein
MVQAGMHAGSLPQAENSLQQHALQSVAPYSAVVHVLVPPWKVTVDGHAAGHRAATHEFKLHIAVERDADGTLPLQ